MSSVKQLLSNLDNNLRSSELDFVKTLKITNESTNSDLDQLFLEKGFSKMNLLTSATQTLSVTNYDDNEEQNALLTRLEQAQVRLRDYLDTLREQIVAIVEVESEGFLRVAARLDGFK